MTDTDLVHQIIHTRRRTLALEISPEARLIVRAPEKVPERIIRDLIEQKRSWIVRKQQQVLEISKSVVRPEFVQGAEFLYLGERYQLSVDPKPVRPFLFNGKEFLISETFLPRARRLFEAWYRERAREVLRARVRFYGVPAGFEYTKLSISGAKTRWGSCGPRDTLNFSWRLVMAPLWIIDYVAVHELTHLRERNHSRRFWKKVEELFPDYRQAQRWLRENQYLLGDF